MREPAIPSTPNDLYDHLRASDNPAEAVMRVLFVSRKGKVIDIR